MLVPVTGPTFWLIDSDAAPSTVHASLLDWPTLIADGEAVKLLITGVAAPDTVTVAVAVTLPAALPAVSV